MALRARIFTYGIGSNGLTGFEYALAGKQAGDEGAITFQEYNLSELFGHILPCEIQSRLTVGQGYVQYRITDVADTTPTEVVRSMAGAAVGADATVVEINRPRRGFIRIKIRVLHQS